MSDNHRRYRTIRRALNQFYPDEPQGNRARHLNTMAGLISGIVGSHRTNLPQIAHKVPNGTRVHSRIQRFARWVDNDRIDLETYFAPYAQLLLTSLAQQPMVLIMDASAVGRKCAALMLSVVYKQRALPLGWIVLKGNKGHFSEQMHLALLDQVHPLIPEDAQITFLGDGEFDGVDLQRRLHQYQWKYACRTAKNTQLRQGHTTFACEEIPAKRGNYCHCPRVYVTHAEFGPVHAIAWWDEKCDEPIYLVTNMANAEEACAQYTLRFLVETFFSDQKSRGFHLHKSHLSDPARLERLMIAACLAYIWIIFLGALVLDQGQIARIHRADRCDLSLFQLGLRWLEHLLNENEPIPVAFQMDRLAA